MSELEYCAFCDDGYAHSGICDKCAEELAQTGKQLAEARAALDALSLEVGQALVLRSVDFSAGEDVGLRSHAIWVAMRETIKERDDARAEIERLTLLAQNQDIVIAAQRRSAITKDKLIEQMRELLQLKNAILGHCRFVTYPPKKIIEKLEKIEAALSAAERGK